MAAVEAPHHLQSALETLSPDDFETASIRSAAPSYTSDAPSYHSTILNPDPLPPYSPRETLGNRNSTTPSSSRPSLLPSDPSFPPAPGLPPVPSGPLRNHHIPTIPTLGYFRIPSWSTISSPTARVALRRSAGGGGGGRDTRPHHHNHLQLQDARRIMLLDRIVEEESARERTRRLEDPYLVGEYAAAQARRERLARERSSGGGSGDEVLIREDRRWDFFLGELSGRRARGGRLAMMR
ncbi:hypothetical protein B0T18DRAFT_389008 [Schizothecium vesticola]|uniref:Uncharacterized protein n=1 Tax=Schizothecium vesticola TaxID=314040 RepID=A0AA40F1C6_9PEZI|nr:hypothetical protein B0T18DRAFT_389008 [Schizothecium vesticola]